MNKIFYMFCFSILIGFTGCVSKNSVLFVTKTSLGVDFDGKPPNLSVAYDRVEGYLGPRYENGAVPPVLGRVQTDGGIFSAKVKQIYATGNAALTIAKKQLVSEPADLEGEKKLMFFGTSTTTGLKVGFTGQIPDSFLFGFKRKEFSYIPVGSKDNKDYYPSVLAAFDNTAHAKSGEDAGLRGGQFFATGSAAEYLANDEGIRNYFTEQASEAFKSYYESANKQNEESLGILRCYAGIKEDDLPQVWEDANNNGLFKEQNSFNQVMEWFNNAKKNPSEEKEYIRRANKRYASEIYITDGTNPLRVSNLQKHHEKVCELAKK